MSRSVDIGPRIGVMGEKEFINSMRAIDSQISANNKQLKTLAAQYDATDKSTKNLAKQQETLKDSLAAAERKTAALTTEYTRQQKELDRLKAVSEQVTKEHGANSKEAEKAANAYLNQSKKVNDLAGKLATAEGQVYSFTEQLRDNAAQMAEAKSVAGKLGTAIESVGTKAQAAGQLVTTVGDKVSSVGTALTVGVTTPIIAAGTASANAALTFEDSMANINTLLDDSSHLDKYESKVKELSRETGKDLATMSDGMYQAISSLGDGDDTAAIFGTMAKSAKAGGAEVADAVSLISAGMKGYNSVNAETAELISDLAFMTAKLGVTTFPEMAKSMQPLFPLSSSLSLSYQELFGTMATLTGVTGNTSEVSTQLKAVFSNLIKPTESMTQLLEKYGYANGQALIESEGFAGALQLLKEETGGQSDKLAQLFSSTEALTAITALTGAQCDTFADKLAQMGDVTGTTETAYQKLETRGDSLRKTINEVKVISTEFGEEIVPALEPLLEIASEAVDKFAQLSDRQKETVVETAALAAAAGPALKIGGSAISTIGKVTTGAGKLASGVGKLAKDFGKVKAAASAAKQVGDFSAKTITAVKGVSNLSKVLAAVASPAGAAVAGLAAVGAAAYVVHEKMVDAEIDRHFGDISLSAGEVLDIAERLTENEWTVKVGAVVDAKNQLAELEKDIKATREEIEKTQWKVSIGVELTASENEEYKANLDKLLEDNKNYITQSGYTAKLAIDTTLGMDTAAGQGLADFAGTFYGELYDKMEELGEAMAATVNASFEGNVLLADNLHLQGIIAQMDEVVQQISDMELKAKIENSKIELEMGGYGIDVESFERLNEQMTKDLQETLEASEESRLSALTVAIGQRDKLVDLGVTEDFAERLYNDTYNAIETQLADKQGQQLQIGFDFAFDTISQNFADELPQATENITGYIDKFYGEIGNSLGSMDALEMWVTDLNIEMPKCSEAASETISTALTALQPNKQKLEELRDQCLAAGQSVPESISEGLNEIYYYQAMSGDINGIYELLGQQIANDPAQFAAIREAAKSGTKIPAELGEAIAHNSNYVFDAATNMLKEVEVAEGLSRGEVLRMLNTYGEELGEEYANGIAKTYGLVYKNGQWVVDKTAQGIKDKTPAATEAGKESVRTITGGMQSEADAHPVSVKVATDQATTTLQKSIDTWRSYALNNPITVGVKVQENAYLVNKRADVLTELITPHATGGIFTTPHVALVAEEPAGEAIIPLSPARRDRALEILNETAALIGYDPYAYAAEMGRARGERSQIAPRAAAVAGGSTTTFAAGAIQTTINTQAQDPNAIYRTIKRRMTREVDLAARRGK